MHGLVVHRHRLVVQDPKPPTRTKGGRPLRPSVPLTDRLKAEMEQTLTDLRALSDRLFELGNQ